MHEFKPGHRCHVGSGPLLKMSAAGTQPRTAESEAVDASVQRDVGFANAIAYI